MSEMDIHFKSRHFTEDLPCIGLRIQGYPPVFAEQIEIKGKKTNIHKLLRRGLRRGYREL